MGSGKTTVGRLLAKKLKVPFIDIDEEIKLREGLDIPEIFSLKGEDYFRQLEFDILRELSRKFSQFVISTGGGLGANPKAMQYMKQNGTVIWLDADFSRIKRRILKDFSRPLVKKLSLQELENLYNKRRNIYSQAHIRVESLKTPEETVLQILSLIDL